MCDRLQQGEGVGTRREIGDDQSEDGFAGHGILAGKRTRRTVPDRFDRIAGKRHEARVGNRGKGDAPGTVDAEGKPAERAALDRGFAGQIVRSAGQAAGQTVFVHREGGRCRVDRRAFVRQADLEGRRRGIVVTVLDLIGEGLDHIPIGSGDVRRRRVDEIPAHDRDRAAQAAGADDGDRRRALTVRAIQVVGKQICDGTDDNGGRVVVDAGKLAVIGGERNIIDNVDLDAAGAQNVAERILDAVIEALGIEDGIGRILDSVGIGERRVERVGIGTVGIERQRTVGTVRRAFQNVDERTGGPGNGDLAAGEDFAGVALVGGIAVGKLARAVRQAGFIDDRAIVGHFGADIVDVDGQRRRREVAVAIADRVHEDVLLIRIDLVGIGCVGVGPVRVKRERAVQADDRRSDAARDLGRGVATSGANAFDRGNAVCTRNIVVEHADRAADERRAFGHRAGIGLRLGSVVDDGDDEIVRAVVGRGIAIEVDDLDREGHGGVAAVDVVVAERVVLERVGVVDRALAGHRIVGDTRDDERAGRIVDDRLVVGRGSGIVVQINLDAVDDDRRETVGRIERDGRVADLAVDQLAVVRIVVRIAVGTFTRSDGLVATRR